MQAAVVPEGLAAMPPGPALAAALHAIELARMPNDRVLEVLAAQHRQLGHEQARMAATLAEIGRCNHIAAPGAVTWLDRPGRYAAEESRAALYWTRHVAENEHDLAETPGAAATPHTDPCGRPRATPTTRPVASPGTRPAPRT